MLTSKETRLETKLTQELANLAYLPQVDGENQFYLSLPVPKEGEEVFADGTNWVPVIRFPESELEEKIAESSKLAKAQSK